MYETIKTTEGERVVRMTLARPPLNVLNIAMMGEINAYLETLADRTDLCLLVIDGEGKSFCAGVDVPEHRKDTVDLMLKTFHQTFRLLYRLPMPTLCAVHGGAYGGGMELATFCDIILAADNLKIGVPEITLGVFPPVAVAYLTRMLGVHRAAELIYTGSIIDAEEARRIGLVNHVFGADELTGAVDKYVAKFGKLSAYSLRKAKDSMRAVVGQDFETALATAETLFLKDLMAGEDPTEGLQAFMDKRAPSWADR